MASNPPPNRKRAQPSNTSLGGPRSRNPAQPRKSIGPSTAGVAKKRKSSSVGVASRLSTQSNNAKRGRPKGSTNRGVSSRRGTRGDDNDDDEAQEEYQDDDDDDDDSSRTKKRGRTSSVTQRSSLGTSAVIGRRGIPQPNQPGSHAASDKPQQRPGPQDQDSNREASSAPPSPPKPYVHVAPYTRRVRQSAIEAKWSPLANASLTAVSTTLQHAQRPILQRISDSQLRREYTSSALRLITHRITRKISRGLPFPPASMPANVGRAPLQSDGGREVELNFESVLDGKVALERQLEPALDGLEVLRREKETLEEELERDYETLRTLEAGARAQAREQRSLLRRAHVLAPVAGNGNPDGDRDGETEEGEFELAREEDVARSGAFTEILQDDDIQPLAVQLGTHVDNIRANLEQTDDLMPQLTKSRAALRAVLLRHLDMRVYEQVVLG